MKRVVKNTTTMAVQGGQLRKMKKKLRTLKRKEEITERVRTGMKGKK